MGEWLAVPRGGTMTIQHCASTAVYNTSVLLTSKLEVLELETSTALRRPLGVWAGFGVQRPAFKAGSSSSCRAGRLGRIRHVGRACVGDVRLEAAGLARGPAHCVVYGRTVKWGAGMKVTGVRPVRSARESTRVSDFCLPLTATDSPWPLAFTTCTVRCLSVPNRRVTGREI